MNDYYLEMAHSYDVQSWHVNSYVIKISIYVQSIMLVH